MRRLTALPRITRTPDALKAAIQRKRALRRNTAVEQRELNIAIAHQLRREHKQGRA